MKTLIWKFRFARAARRLMGVTWATGWDMAGTWLVDIIDRDTSQSPEDCAEEERDEWIAST